METVDKNKFISVKNVWGILKNNWVIITWCAVIGVIAAAIISFVFMTPKYSSSSDLLVNQKVDNNSVQYAVQQADLQAINTYKDILKKPIILNEVLKELKEKDNYAGNVESLSEAISISNSTNSQVVTITATDANAYVAADMANAVAKVFKDKIKTIMKVNNVTIVSTAKAKTTPVSPNKKLNIALGLVAGALIGVIIGVVKDLMDNTVKDTEFLTDDLALTNLGLVYHIENRDYQIVEVLEDSSEDEDDTRRV
ncbi:YveK family protein [Ligilactobacillus apodemi]|uniref:Capsular polysaccharide biosynthesis protein CpsC n=1 Tax=Ligilactobacillus apodemi DSM 16634 = JCM 16172 TaxID=1423724 RepID=A0A0R1U8Y5_9LACO|nr:Wzz/FepE/Etk N-terminal domain-containing protein [Ligilactobacillus apodemi]KRL87445.1 Exopolysaccharide chain length regulator [Ligilactobacillus apodemi DSM 16634 = JCM 16172]